VTEPIQRDERLWCMGLDAYKAGFEQISAAELLRRYPACFAAPAGCERPNRNAPSNVQEAEMRAYLACSAARPAR
jgi:hypothetical protein